MGRAAGARVLESGYGLVVFDPTPAARDWASGAGAVVEMSPAAVAEKAEIILMFLPGPVQIRQCVSGGDGILSRAGACRVIVDLATSDPANTRQLSEAALQRGVGYLDAPILGRPAAIGNWALPVGGRGEDLEQCRPVLELFASRILPIGDSGAGHTIKLLNQMMFGAINAMTAEMIAHFRGNGL